MERSALGSEWPDAFQQRGYLSRTEGLGENGPVAAVWIPRCLHLGRMPNQHDPRTHALDDMAERLFPEPCGIRLDEGVAQRFWRERSKSRIGLLDCLRDDRLAAREVPQRKSQVLRHKRRPDHDKAKV